MGSSVSRAWTNTAVFPGSQGDQDASVQPPAPASVSGSRRASPRAVRRSRTPSGPQSPGGSESEVMVRTVVRPPAAAGTVNAYSTSRWPGAGSIAGPDGGSMTRSAPRRSASEASRSPTRASPSADSVRARNADPSRPDVMTRPSARYSILLGSVQASVHTSRRTSSPVDAAEGDGARLVVAGAGAGVAGARLAGADAAADDAGVGGAGGATETAGAGDPGPPVPPEQAASADTAMTSASAPARAGHPRRREPPFIASPWVSAPRRIPARRAATSGTAYRSRVGSPVPDHRARVRRTAVGRVVSSLSRAVRVPRTPRASPRCARPAAPCVRARSRTPPGWTTRPRRAARARAAPRAP